MITWAMEPEPDGEFQRLLELARDSAGALLEAGVAPRSPVPSLRGWLAVERLAHTDVTHAAGADSEPQSEEVHLDQIWLTDDGRLQNARRVRAAPIDRTASAAGAGPAAQSDATQAGAVIASRRDIGARWDGPYGGTSRWSDSVERTVQDTPAGPREDPATRIAAALERTTAELLDGGGVEPAPSEPDDPRAHDAQAGRGTRRLRGGRAHEAEVGRGPRCLVGRAQDAEAGQDARRRRGRAVGRGDDVAHMVLRTSTRPSARCCGLRR